MKIRFLIILLVDFLSVSLFASDMIVTKDARKIDAKILEVSSSEIKYKKMSNPNGPTYVMSVAEIQTVVYENGEVEIYEERKEEEVAKPVEKAENYNRVAEVKPQNETTQKLSEEKTTKGKEDNSDNGTSPKNSSIVEMKNDYYGSDPVYENERIRVEKTLKTNGDVLGYRSLNGKRLTSDEYMNYLRKHCVPALETYRKGNRFLGAGIAMIVMGEMLGVVSLTIDNIPVLAIGSFIELVGIPMIICGAKKRRKSLKVYEKNCINNDVAFEYRVGVTGKGVGVLLNF